MSDIEHDPKANQNHQRKMPTTTEEANVNSVSGEKFDGPLKLSALCAKSCNSLKETTANCDGLTIPTKVEKSDGLTPPADATIDDEIEAGEISSPKGSDGEEGEDEKKFAVECELDFEEEGADREAAELPMKKVKNKEESGEKGGGDDDGECTDEVDEDVEELEEGELKDEIPNPLDTNTSLSSKPNAPTKTVCRFYNRGVCFYGNNCRFLHVNHLKTGNYSMFAPAPKGFPDGYDPVGSMTHGMINHRSGVAPSRTGPDFPPVPSLCPQAPSPEPVAALESAWVRALTEAKELVKKANKRKIEEPDFEEKRLNLSLVVNEKNIPEENEIHYKKKKRENSTFIKREFDDPHDIYNDGYEPRPHWREGHFDSMEINYEKELRRGRGRMDRERDKFPKSPDKDRFRDGRLQQVQSRSRVDDYFDPWRRSKSPKGNIRRTRSRSGSYSSVSSYSYSTRSSRSSCSYSRTSSSSRSPHPHQKRTPSPSNLNPPFVSPKLGPNKFSTMKNKPGGRPSSRSMSRTPSRSRSRSFSRSISMDSVSSASSSISRSSHSEPGHQTSHASLLRKQENPLTAVGSDPAIVASSNPPSLPTTYLNYNPPIVKVEKDTPKPPIMDEDERDPLEEKFLTPAPVDIPFPSLQHLLPSIDKPKEPFKGTPHKQQIKLTLLNKTPKLNNLPKKELDLNKKHNDEPSKPVGFYIGVKGPLSPPVPPVAAKPTPVLVPKKSASSRRDELLKQLKAVEDAIARKRAKFG